jgi:hypothetical protein
MTATQMGFLGLKEFKYDEVAQEVNLVLKVDKVGDVPMKLQLKNGRLDTAKVRLGRLLISGFIQRYPTSR